MSSLILIGSCYLVYVAVGPIASDDGLFRTWELLPWNAVQAFLIYICLQYHIQAGKEGHKGVVELSTTAFGLNKAAACDHVLPGLVGVALMNIHVFDIRLSLRYS